MTTTKTHNRPDGFGLATIARRVLVNCIQEKRASTNSRHTMKQIADWLEKLGMSEYAEQFAENDIDLSVLVDLTDQDLKELGVASLGHRRKLLRAIADFEAIGKSAPAVTVAAAAPAAPRPLDTAERRQLTVMFCDLVGSTALSARLDPEDMREIVGAYHRCCTDLITGAGGFVAKYMGDGAGLFRLSPGPRA